MQNDRTGTEGQLFFSGTVVGPLVLKNLVRYFISLKMIIKVPKSIAIVVVSIF